MPVDKTKIAAANGKLWAAQQSMRAAERLLIESGVADFPPIAEQVKAVTYGLASLEAATAWAKAP